MDESDLSSNYCPLRSGSFFSSTTDTTPLDSSTLSNHNINSETEKSSIKDICRHIPAVGKSYKIYKIIGEGTFSQVFKGVERSKCRKEVAIKYIKPNVCPNRIRFEVLCLLNLCNSTDTIDVLKCFSNAGRVAIVMPYIHHAHLQELAEKMTVNEIRLYIYHLIKALESVHQLGIIHRDIKGGNFLCHPKTNPAEYRLIDFGLAQQESGMPILHDFKSHAKLESTYKAPDVPPSSNKRRKMSHDIEKFPVTRSRTPMKLSADTKSVDWLNPKTDNESFVMPASRKQERKAYGVSRKRLREVKTSNGTSNNKRKNRNCYCGSEDGRDSVCDYCLHRCDQHAPRAGTPGFRPPEVLMKYEKQTTAVDMWACGVLFLSLLSGRYPFFQPASDLVALHQIIHLLGVKRVRSAAKAMNKTLRGVGVASEVGQELRQLCADARRADSVTTAKGGVLKEAANGDTVWCHGEEVPDTAFKLLEQLLDPNPHTRISAKQALRHPFLLQLA